jgi:1-deoxy-D-xylulose-5-phosphate reductoisomerase
MTRIAIVGATGSIGQSALAVVAAHPERLRVVALAAGENSSRLVGQVCATGADTIAMASAQALSDVEAELRSKGLGKSLRTSASGPEGLLAVATHPEADIVLFASAGTAALDAVLAAIDAGKTIAIANKEILVMAGELVMKAAHDRGVTILPVDSEHNAIHQCLHGRAASEIRRLILTASGGPFRGSAREHLQQVTPDDALRHPTWRMGPKITIDSATLMNKGLEVIEAHWLFDVRRDQLDVLVHPQSVVHSLVELVDGSVIAQLGVTDMQMPIQYAFSYPERWASPLPSLDLARAGRLDFEAPDVGCFPCLALAFRALEGDSGLPVVLNAANEIAVAAFLDRRISFVAIPVLISAAMDAYEKSGRRKMASLDDVRSIDGWARGFAEQQTHEVNSNV